MPRRKKQSRKVKEADKNDDLNAIAGDSPQVATWNAAIAEERSQSPEQDPRLLLQDDIPSASEVQRLLYDQNDLNFQSNSDSEISSLRSSQSDFSSTSSSSSSSLSIPTHKRKRKRSKTNKIISKALGVKRRQFIASEFSDDDEDVLDATRKVKKRKTSWPKFELSKPWPGHEDQAAFDAAAASAVSTNASLQALEGFDLPPKRRLKLLLRNFRLSLRSAQLSQTSRENRLLSFQGQRIMAAAPPAGAFRSKRLSSLNKLQKQATKLGLIRESQAPRPSSRSNFKSNYKRRFKRGRHSNSVSRGQTSKQRFQK
ncbi:MAG: hypothetical protein EZS28_040854 [Streblomastix strix]|uniref:Uncharacterized protein n=1 Tax=Streblomastix strix TaxID=222440 RepID=A0A5J4U047_9EUKA|nr:MAG: hypothetical protein EZS28_040854 [Streblomastix strix]